MVHDQDIAVVVVVVVVVVVAFFVYNCLPRSILVFSGRHHIMFNVSIVNNCIMSTEIEVNNCYVR